jgi:hypothetical protein
MYYVRFGDCKTPTLRLAGKVPDLNDVLELGFPGVGGTAPFRVYERRVCFLPMGDQEYGEYVVLVTPEPALPVTEPNPLSEIYQKLGAKTVGDKMTWVGPNYSKSDLFADLEKLLK